MRESVRMERWQKFYVGLLLMAIAFAAWGFSRWLQARAFRPEIPVAAAAPRYVYQKPQPVPALSRYAKLQNGALFFGPEAVAAASGAAVAQPKIEFHSQLLLYGVTKGETFRTDRAVVGIIGDPGRRTWLARAGTAIEGETVVGIEAKGIWVKNATGKGRVGLMQPDAD
jgi:hypothetical protein